MRANLTKFPVNFPVSREFGSGDGFDCDCVRHQQFQCYATTVDDGRGPQRRCWSGHEADGAEGVRVTGCCATAATSAASSARKRTIQHSVKPAEVAATGDVKDRNSVLRTVGTPLGVLWMSATRNVVVGLLAEMPTSPILTYVNALCRPSYNFWHRMAPTFRG